MEQQFDEGVVYCRGQQNFDQVAIEDTQVAALEKEKREDEDDR